MAHVISGAQGAEGGPVSITLDVGEGTNRKVIAYGYAQNTSGAGSVVRDPGGDEEEFTQVGTAVGGQISGTNYRLAEFWLDLPDELTGEQTFRFTGASGTFRTAFSVHIWDEMTPGAPAVVGPGVQLASSGASVSESITTTAAKQVIFSAVGFLGSYIAPTFTANNGQTKRTDIVTDLSLALAGGDLLKETAGAQTIGWTATGASPLRLQLLSAYSLLDEVAPVLSTPSVEAVSDILGAGEFTTDEAGDWSAVLTLSASPPSAAQVEAGEDENGDPAAAVDSGFAEAGTVTVGWSGLTAETSYYGYAVVRDGAGNVSNVLYLGTFTTLPPDDGVFITGTVVLEGGAPIEGARIYLIDTQSNPIRTVDTYTDENGVYLFEGLADDGRKYLVVGQHEAGGVRYSGRGQPYLEPT